MGTRKNKIALVTGGSRGLGKNMALSIADKGLDVIITYNSNHTEAEKVVASIQEKGQKAAALQLSVDQVKSFPKFINRLAEILQQHFEAETIHYLINNAGIGIHEGISETSEEQFNQLMNVHVKGPQFLTQHLLPMLANGGGIVNLSTGLTRFALPGYSAYASMKGAMEVYTKYLAKELGARRIKANSVAPGAIETDFGGGVVRDNEEVNKYISATTALGRVGLPEDIGGVVAFLCSEEASWINAQRLEVSGGQNI